MDATSTTPLPVENSSVPGSDNILVSTQDAASLAVQHSGIKGGRGRIDGLIPGSIEAIEADKAKDRERKRRNRRPAGAPSDAPPLPSKVDAVEAPRVALGPVPWHSDQLTALFAQIVPAIERADVASLVKKAKIIPGMPPELVSEIEKDAAWNTAAKSSIESAGPQVAAKYLNKWGIGADNAPEIILCGAIVAIVSSRSILANKLDAMAKGKSPEKKP